jgi:hypothetical protein
MKEKGTQYACFINAILSLFDGPTPSIYKSFLENCGTFLGDGGWEKGWGCQDPMYIEKKMA